MAGFKVNAYESKTEQHDRMPQAFCPTTPTGPPRFLSFCSLELPPVSPLGVDMSLEDERGVTDEEMKKHQAGNWNSVASIITEIAKRKDNDIKKLVAVPEKECPNEVKEESRKSLECHASIAIKSDDRLQSTNNRRRHMRRGAKSPSMLYMCRVSDFDIAEPSARTDENTFVQSPGLEETKDRRKHPQTESTSMLHLPKVDLNCLERERQPVVDTWGFNLVSALKMNLERSSVIDPKNAKRIGQMSALERRRYTCELLAQI